MDSISLELDQLLNQLGQVGKRLSDIGAAEGASGNLSICLREKLDVTALFPRVQTIQLPAPALELADATLIVTGSGQRLREIVDLPTDALACIVVEAGGRTGKMFTSPDCRFARVTSEFNSHLAVHHDQMRSRDLKLHTVLHAQPLHITYLSHLPDYQDEGNLNRRLLRWQPETILNFPDGIGVLPFLLPGSAQLMIETMLSLRTHQIVVWAQHGVMARADDSIFHALDLIEYAETAAQYEFLNLAANAAGAGLSPENLRALSAEWNVRQSIF